MKQDHSGTIWVLGILLVLAVAVTSPYWQRVGIAVGSGGVATQSGWLPVTAANAGEFQQLGNAFAPGSGLMLTIGAFVAVLVFVGMANASEGLGAVALMLLIGFWVLFLLHHTSGVSGFFGRFTAPAKQG